MLSMAGWHTVSEQKGDANVAQALKRLRAAAGMTQEQAAHAVGLTLSGYRNYEQGKRHLRVEQLDRFAGAFGVPASVLADQLGLNQSAPPHPRL